MSMLADWFFCTTMRLSPEDTHAYLDTLAALRRPEPDPSEVLDATTALGPAPPWLQLYALRPLLTAHGRLADRVAASSDVDSAVSTTGAYGDPELGRRVIALAEAVLSSTDHPLAARLGVLLGAVVRDDEAARTHLLAEIAGPLAAQPDLAAASVTGTPYHDLNDRIVPTVAVLALAELTRRRPTAAAQDWLGDNADPLLAGALRGEYGRLALLAAVEAAGRTDPQAREDIWRNLWRDGRRAPHLQPDLLDALARLWFGHPDSDDPPTVAELEAEAITGEDLALWTAYLRPESIATGEYYALLTGHTNGGWNAMSAVLWQSVLWSLAAEVDPVETAARLARWWQTPSRTPGEPTEIHVGSASARAAEHLALLQQVAWAPGAQVVVDAAPITQTTPANGSAACSPWIDRWHDGWDHNRKTGPAFRYPPSGTPEPMLRLFASTVLAVSLLESAPVGDAHDHLVAVVFHCVDVCRDQSALLNALAMGEYTGEHPLGPALVSMLSHVYHVAQDAGVGSADRVDPRVFGDYAARMLEDGSTADLDGGQEQVARLARQALGAICLMWIRLAWVRSTPLRPELGPGRWFLGDPPYALTVLMSAIDRTSQLEVHYRDRRRQEAQRRNEIARQWEALPPDNRTPKPVFGPSLIRGLWPPDVMPLAQALREIYPADWPEPVAERWPQLDLDWYPLRAKLRELYLGHLKHAGNDPAAVAVNTVRSERLLLSPTHPLEVWRDASVDLEGWVRIDRAPITMRALRLAALLGDAAATASGENAEWIEDWLDRLYAVNHDGELSPDVRAIMIRLLELRAPEAGPDYQRRLSAVHEATIDVILEFGATATPRHVAMLLDRLAGAAGLGREGLDRLRLRALETIYRQRRYRDGSPDLGSVTRLRRLRRAEADQRLAVRRFLDEIANPRGDATERVPILERARDLWERTQVRPLLRGLRVPLSDRRRGAGGERVPDLLVAATVTDRFAAQEVSYLLDVVVPGQAGPDRPHDLFPGAGDRRRVLDEAARTSGTAYAVVAAVSDGRLFLNAGLGEPLTAAAPADLDLRPGDVVAAELTGRPTAVAAVRRIPRPDPEPGEVRTATVRAARPFLRVAVDGVPGEAYPAGDGAEAEAVRRLWDPDLSRAFDATAADDAALTMPVRWDAGLGHWLPVERRFTELILDEPDLTAGVRLVHAGGDRFVTRPGRLYRLSGVDWRDPDAVEALLDGQRGGLILHAHKPGGEPRLSVFRADDRNLRWQKLFSDTENEFTVAVKGESGYTIEVDAPDGFRDTVVARGAEGGPQRAYVITAPWNDRQARRAEVAVTLVPVYGMSDPEHPTAERFATMSTVAVGDAVHLARIFSTNRDDALVWATTENDLAVRLETDSITLLDPHAVGRTDPALVRGRIAEVVRVRTTAPSPTGAALSTSDLLARVRTAGATEESINRAVRSADRVDGVVVSRASAPGRGGDTVYGTWCRFGDAVHFVELDQATLGGTSAQLAGQTFAGARAGDSWTFRFVPREITVRGLFEVRETSTSAQPRYAGTDGTADIYQVRSRPVLERRPSTGGDPVRRLELAEAGVALIDRRPLPTRTIAVRGPTGLFGSTGYRGNPADARVTGVRLRITDSAVGHGLVDVRRTFTLTARTAAAPRPAMVVDHAGRWHRFVESGQDHVTGTVARGHVDVAGGLRPPGPDGEFTARLPLLPGEEPLVAGVPYRSLGARIRLVPSGEGYAGSYATARPKTVPEFMAQMNQQAGGPPQSFGDALYYVGPPTAELDAHLFEWGYGWTVAVPVDRLRVAGSPERGGLPPLFHGDRIEAASFAAADDGGDPVMVIAWRDIRPRYVTQIVEEAVQKHLHLLEVEIGVAAGTVRVLRAQAGRRRGDDPFRGAEWVPFPAALDSASMESIFRRLRESGETGLVRRRILARFDKDAAISTGGRERLFTAVRSGGTGLEDMDRVFLTAREVEESANELTVIFGAPDALNAGDLAVRVNRREFSFRESTLARLLARGLDVAAAEIVMLVRVSAPDSRGVRHGSIKDGPARRPETLVSYLASRGGTCYAVFGRVDRGEGRLEIAPGVLYSTAGVIGAGGARHGAVVRLSLDGARRVVLTTALPADRSYVGTTGRPAVVLPKSTLLRRNRAERTGEMPRGFVVSGLPDVQTTPGNGVGPVMLAAAHPKVGWVRLARDGRALLRLAARDEARIARLSRPNADQPAQATPRTLPGEPRWERDSVPVPWARISFRYATARAIARMCADLRWQHHDRSTGHVRRDGRIVAYPVDPGSPMTDGVFFDDDAGWTLRYRPDRLATFGFPAGELLDGTGPQRALPVAGPSADGGGVWVELGPGRLVEVRGALVTADGRASLMDLDWPAFSPGDLIGLRVADAEQRAGDWQATQGHLELTSWRPAVTAALSRDDRGARILLPVRGADRAAGALNLGDGRWRLTYPLARSAMGALSGVPAVWLDARNDVEAYADGSVRRGDTVLLGCGEDGELIVHGMPGAEVRVAAAGERLWPGGDWLRRGLTDEGTRASLIAALDRQLPVTVRSVGVDRPVLTVSRERQPSGAWPSGRQVRTELLGAWTEDRLLLRAGGSVYSVPVTEAVAGVPAGLVGAVASALTATAANGTGRRDAQPLVLWWRVEPDGTRRPGLVPAADTGGQDVVVVPELEVAADGRAAGLVCRDAATGRLHWMSADQASWVRDVPAGDLLPNIAGAARGAGDKSGVGRDKSGVPTTPAGADKSGKLAVRLLPDGSLSIIARPAVTHQLRRLELGAPLRVVLGEGRPQPTADGRWRYLARIEMPPVLVSYVSADARQKPGTSRLAEVDDLDRHDQPAVTTVDVNTRLVTLDLPAWLPAAHQAIVDGTGGTGVGRFVAYRDWYRAGLDGTATPEDPAEAVLRLAGDLVDAGPGGVDVKVLSDVAGRWLSTYGEAAFNLTGDVELDAAPLLAGALVLTALADADQAWRRASVLCLHQIGRRAAASLHTEQFATAWIGRPDRHALGGAWVRLRALSLARELSPREVRQLRQFCRAMLTKPALRTAESALAPIARSLLAAVGALESAEELLGDAVVLSVPATWARTLLTPDGYPAAQPVLLPAQRAELRAAVEHVAGDAVPLTLLPVVAPPGQDERDLARRLLREVGGATG